MKVIVLEKRVWINYDFGPEYESIEVFKLYTTKDKARKWLKENVIRYIKEGVWLDDDTFSYNDEKDVEYCTKWIIREVEVM